MVAPLGSCQGYIFPHAEVLHTFQGVHFTVHLAQVKRLSSSLASWIVRIYMGAEVHFDDECMPVLALIESLCDHWKETARKRGSCSCM